MATIPRIDPLVRFITPGTLRRLDTEQLQAQTFVVQQGETPIAVVLPHRSFLAMQEEMDRQDRCLVEMETRLIAADAAGRTLGQMVGART